MGFAVPAIEVLDLRFEGLVVAHPAAVALRVGGLEGDVGPVVKADAELKGLAVEAFDVHVRPRRVQDVDYRGAFQDPVGVREVFAK